MSRPRLSPTECEILCLIADGLSDPQIAAALYKSPRTIDAHRDRLFSKTGSHNRVQLTRYAIAMGYVPVAWKLGRSMDTQQP